MSQFQLLLFEDLCGTTSITLPPAGLGFIFSCAKKKGGGERFGFIGPFGSEVYWLGLQG